MWALTDTKNAGALVLDFPAYKTVKNTSLMLRSQPFWCFVPIAPN
jgi:hypothetical protein